MCCSPVAIVIADTAPYFRLVFLVAVAMGFASLSRSLFSGSLSPSLFIPSAVFLPHLCSLIAELHLCDILYFAKTNTPLSFFC